MADALVAEAIAWATSSEQKPIPASLQQFLLADGPVAVQSVGPNDTSNDDGVPPTADALQVAFGLVSAICRNAIAPEKLVALLSSACPGAPAPAATSAKTTPEPTPKPALPSWFAVALSECIWSTTMLLEGSDSAVPASTLAEAEPQSQPSTETAPAPASKSEAAATPATQKTAATAAPPAKARVVHYG